jgi:erythronate-4-phosphate dehydrogenase
MCQDFHQFHQEARRLDSLRQSGPKTHLHLEINPYNIINFSEKSMIIALDRALPHWKDIFWELGEILPFSGRDLKPEDIRGADALIVRTVTPVNASLLEGSSIRFVGAASAGMDHIDRTYLEQKGIHFCYAAGCNANAVSEYITTALHIIAARKNWKLKNKSIGVIGVGHVGSRVSKKAHALGMHVLLYDPPLRELTGDPRYLSLDAVLKADILTFHVPLTSSGPYPTWHMLNRSFLDRLSPDQFLINSSRGEVFDGQKLKSALKEGRIAGAILDVWEKEPDIDYSLLELADIGTPHIAGTSLDGKIKATEMIRSELCTFFGYLSRKNNDTLYPEIQRICPKTGSGSQDAVLSILQQAFNLEKDDADLRALAYAPAGQTSEHFEKLRTQHPLRPEFSHFVVDLVTRHRDLAETFSGIGFQCRI